MEFNKKIKFIDLFCGIGSFHYSFHKVGFECVMACDIFKSAVETYEKNYHITPLGDITTIDPKNISTFDIVCAGFPCQPFSNIGQHKGMDDERGMLFYQIMKFVKYSKPKIILLENVPALLKHDNGKTFQKIREEIEKEDYNVEYNILLCSDYEIPQNRKRLFIVGIRNDLKINNILKFKKIGTKTLSEFFGKEFNKKIAYTIRCGGKKSPINDKHNWDGYVVDGKEYRLSIQDCLKLQGFENFELCGSKTEQFKLVGNTIPTNFTKLIAERLKEKL
jgi:DNA (cytosine-5)-methyltransferase 1